MIVRGTTETRDELTGNFGSALEDTSISDYRLIALFAEKTLNAIFGVLQHYPLKSGRRQATPAGPFRPISDIIRLPDPREVVRFRPATSGLKFLTEAR